MAVGDRGLSVDTVHLNRLVQLLETQIVSQLDAALSDLATGLLPQNRPLGNDPRHAQVEAIGTRQQQNASDYLDRLRSLRSEVKALCRAAEGLSARYSCADETNADRVTDSMAER